MIPTAKEFYDEHYSDDTVVIMRDYAKMLTDRMYSEEEVDNLCELIKQNERKWDLFDKNIIKIKPKSYYEIIEQFKKR